MENTLEKKWGLVWVGVGLLLLSSACGCTFAAEETKPPNILFLVIDALRPDHLGYFGYLRDPSPFIDGVCGKGVVFENTISQASWTKTSMSSFLASVYPELHGMRGVKDVLPEEILLVSEVLRASGYRTCCIHGNPWMREQFGFNQGYDKFVYRYFHKAEKIHAEALTWLAEESDRPFFVYLHYMDVHRPYRPPEEFAVFGEKNPDRYDGEILALDTELEKFFRELDKKGLSSNTWVIITADHGEEFGEHGGNRHGHALYQEVIKIPLVFYHPGIVYGGKRIKRQVRAVDVSPTLLNLAGVPIPETMEGVSLKDDIFALFNFRRSLEAFSQVGLNDMIPDKDLIAVSSPPLKYIYDFKSTARELYDLRNDPEEKNNLVAAHPEIAERFQEKIEQYKQLQKEKKHRLRKEDTGEEESLKKEPELDEELKMQLKSLGYLQ